MRINRLNGQHLPNLHKLLTAMLVSSILLMTACSNNDVNEINANNTTDDNTEAVANDTNTTLAEENRTAKTINDNSVKDVDSTVSDSNSVNPDQPSLVNNPTEAGTPEDTVKQALDTLYYGEVKKAATYYSVDMANFEQQLANTQYAFQQTVEGVTITNTIYNDDKTRATIEGELMLKGQKQPEPLSYQLQKIDGIWKILG